MQNPELVIHCFEPQMVIWERSKKLLETQKNIFFKNAALWICDGEIDFYANEKKNMQSSLFANTWLNPYHRVQTIPCITIQSYLKEIKVSQIDLLKMDIE
jgi:FkbM family methyltransferase